MLLPLLFVCALRSSISANLVVNSEFSQLGSDGRTPVGFTLKGNAVRGYGGYVDEAAGMAVSLDSRAGAEKPTGEVSQLVPVDRAKGKWVTFRIQARAEDGFQVKDDGLWLQMDFFSNKGNNYEDTARRLIYHEIERDRKDFAVNGDDHKNGAAVWRTYEFEELLPFAETDTVKISVGEKDGISKEPHYARFFISEISLTQSDQSAFGKVDPADAKGASRAATIPSQENLVSLGGRWYYQPSTGESIATGEGHHLAQRLTITDDNADRLYYKDDRWETPFKGTMTAWLRAGFIDEDGQIAKKDRFVKDNVTLVFDGSGTWTIRAKNIPNHPTAKFPDTYGTQGYNPNYIRAQLRTYTLPIDPKPNPSAVAMTPNNSNMGLNMGSIGFAVNGVVFYNPFDAGMTDASGIMDRCCGHPSPDARYHYHKYPICVNTPFVDKGEAHSPLIGFAFDGFPIYGPYERAGVMAKDDTQNPLNAFNIHFDAAHGWHYHVTPGKFPYILGGYFGTVMSSNLERGPGGGRGGPGGRRGDGGFPPPPGSGQ